MLVVINHFLFYTCFDKLSMTEFCQPELVEGRKNYY